MKKSVQQWITEGKKKHRYLFFHEDKVLDLTEFVSLHPGGKQAILNYTYKDITETLFKVFPHSPQHTINIITKYQIGTIPTKTQPQSYLTSQSSISTPPKKVRFLRKNVGDNERYEASHESSQMSVEKRPALKKPSRFMQGRPRQSSNSKQITSKSKSKTSSKLPQSKYIKGRSFKEDESGQQTKAQRKPFLLDKSKHVFNSQQMDEQKPLLSIPILSTRCMNQI